MSISSYNLAHVYLHLLHILIMNEQTCRTKPQISYFEEATNADLQSIYSIIWKY